MIKRGRGRGSKTSAHLPVEAETAAEILRDGAAASPLLGQMQQPSDRLVTVKDIDYLRWRYGHFEEYRAVRAAGREGGTAIFRPRRRGPFWVLDVCELL